MVLLSCKGGRWDAMDSETCRGFPQESVSLIGWPPRTLPAPKVEGRSHAEGVRPLIRPPRPPTVGAGHGLSPPASSPPASSPPARHHERSRARSRTAHCAPQAKARGGGAVTRPWDPAVPLDLHSPPVCWRWPSPAGLPAPAIGPPAEQRPGVWSAAPPPRKLGLSHPRPCRTVGPRRFRLGSSA